MKKVYSLLFVLLSVAAVKSQTICFDSLYRFSNNYGTERDLAVLDWNSDGILDYAVVNEDSDKVFIYYGSLNSHDFNSIAHSSISILDPFQIETGDVNGDAINDIIILHHGVGYDDSVKVFLSDGIGGVGATIYLDVANSVSVLKVDDINNDNYYDLLVFENISGTTDNFYAYKNNSGSNFSLYLTQPVPFGVIKDVAILDIDNDGDRDIVIGSQDSYWNGSGFDDTSKVIVFSNTTTGIFSYSEIYRYTIPFGTERLTAITAGDFNADSHGDFAITLDISNKIVVFMNDGSNSNFSSIQYSTGSYPVALATADMDGDTDLDLVYTLYYGGNDEIIYNDGAGNFSAPQTVNLISYYTKILLHDMDNDSRVDILHCSSVNSTTSLDVRAAIIYNNTNTNIILTPVTATTVCPGSNVQVAASFDNISFQNSATIDWMTGYSSNDTVTYLINAFTTLSLTAISYNGCNINSFINIFTNAVPNVNLGNDTSTCNSLPIGVTNESGVSYNWTSIPPGFSSSTSGSIVSPSANTTYILEAINGQGCTATDSIYIVLNPSPVMNGSGNSLSVCVNSIINLGDHLYPSGGTPPYSYNWFSGLNTYTTANPAHIADQTQTFTVTITDANGCSVVGPLFTTANPLTYVLGHISTATVSSVAGGSGSVYAFKYQPGGAGFDTMDIAGINATGDYYFYFLDSGQYLIKAILDAPFYPNAVPTYNGNTFQWDSSIVVNHTCAQHDTINIQVLEIDTTQTGPGSISGYIIEEAGFGSGRFGNNGGGPLIPCVPGGPLKGIDVKLGKNPGGGIAARTMTDSTGYYEFDSLPLLGYKIYVDIPNLPMDSTREIVLDANNSVSVQNNYFADSASVYINPDPVVSIYASAKVYSNKFSVYPNPAQDKIFVSFEKLNNSAEITLSDVFGKTVYSDNIEGNSTSIVYPLELSEFNLEAGVYFISLKSDNQMFTQRIILVK